MLSSKAIVVILCFLPFIFASPLQFEEVEKRLTLDTSSHCGEWDSITAGPYSLLLNQWGKHHAGSGSSCASLASMSGTTVSWVTTWTWSGGDDTVKSFGNIQLNNGINKQLSAINSLKAKWKWSQSTSGYTVSNVAYDLFTSNTIGGDNVDEVMIWIGNFNAQPISWSYDYSGAPTPVASNLSLAGYTWSLYSGWNGSNNVYSFLPSNGKVITSFSGDLNLFLKYLTSKGYVNSSQYLKTAQGGTEATSGSARLTTSAYTLAIA